MPHKIDGPTVRARAARLRAIGDRLSTRFRASQIGRVRRALVVDDGSSAVTDNYLKLALDRPCTRNEWVKVLVDGPHTGRVRAP
jgi:tRNA A37 methylthiotransferase MiaB